MLFSGDLILGSGKSKWFLIMLTVLGAQKCAQKCERFFFKQGILFIFIVIRNGKMVWKHGPYRWYFRLNLKYLGWSYRAYNKTARNGDFCEELLSENDFETILSTFCCYHHGARASEAVLKIATDQKEYRKRYSCVIIWWITKICLSINNNKEWLVTRIPLT